MSSIRYALLSLLTREPLSGYDIKLYMNNRLNPFWKAGNNQVYPELSKMEEAGLIRLQEIEQRAYRPHRKLYEITDAGREAIIEWTIEPGGVSNIRDDFFLKVYNSWLVEPEKMKQQIADMKQQHEEKLASYMDKVVEMSKQSETAGEPNPLASNIFVLEFGIRYERLYMEWCDYLLNKI